MYFVSEGPVYTRTPKLGVAPAFEVPKTGWLATNLETKGGNKRLLFVGGMSSGWVPISRLTIVSLRGKMKVDFVPMSVEWHDDGDLKTIKDDIDDLRRGHILWRGDYTIIGYQNDMFLTSEGNLTAGDYCRIAKSTPQRMSRYGGIVNIGV